MFIVFVLLAALLSTYLARKVPLTLGNINRANFVEFNSNFFEFNSNFLVDLYFFLECCFPHFAFVTRDDCLSIAFKNRDFFIGNV